MGPFQFAGAALSFGTNLTAYGGAALIIHSGESF